MKKISIIVHVCKVEKYLICCLESIIHQTYSNLEIILVDDASSDVCVAVCDKYAMMDDRIKVIYQESAGVSETRNVGIKQASGDYLLFVDSHDWLSLDLCERAIKDIEEQQSDILILGYYLADDDGQVIKIEVPFQDECIIGNKAIEMLLLEKIKDYNLIKLYARDMFEGVIYPEGSLFENLSTTYQMFTKAQRVYIVNRALYFCRQRNTSTSDKVSAYNQIEYCDMCIKHFENICKVYPEQIERALAHIIPTVVSTYGLLMNWSDTKKDREKLLEFVLNQKKNIEKNSLLKNNRYVAIFLKYRKLFELYYWMGFPKFKKLHKILENVFSFLLFMKAEKLELSDKDGKPRCFLIGTPDHDNLGDHAIAVATEEYLNANLNGYEIVHISEEKYKRVHRDLKAHLAKSDIIVLQGGGNLGDEYRYIERIRKHILKHFRGKRIILFPQTVFFTDTFRGKLYEKAAQYYYKKSGAYLTAREQVSYEKMKQLFPKNKVFLLPDIVLLLDEKQSDGIRNGALLCLRKDVEATLNWEKRMRIYDICQKIYGDVFYTDTATGIYYNKEAGKIAVREKLEQFSKSGLVVTDRLHGMVFAALTGTPCIVFSNYNAKVKGVYQWISELNYIEFLESCDELEGAIQRLSEVKEKTPYPKDRLMKEYKEVERLLEGWSN